MAMNREARTLLVVVLGTVLLAGGLLTACSSDTDNLSTPSGSHFEDVNIGGNDRISAADFAWSQLTGLGPDYSVHFTGQRYRDFVVLRELERQRFRDEGLRFWREFPSDSRRYTWLILTTRLAPAYPADLEQWSQSEILLGPNPAPTSEADHSNWDGIYDDLRAEFMTSMQVTEQQRRLLVGSELVSQMRRIRNEREAGRPTPDSQQILDRILAYLLKFDGPVDATDQTEAYNFVAERDNVLELALGWPDVLGLEDEDVVSFAEQLLALQPEDDDWHHAIAQAVIAEGTYPSAASWQVDDFKSLWSHFEKEGFENWADWRESANRKFVLSAVRIESGSFPGFGQPSDGASGVIFLRENIGSSLLIFRESGMREFDYMEPIEQVHWLVDTANRLAVFQTGYWPRGFEPVRWWKPKVGDIDWARRDASEKEFNERAKQTLRVDFESLDSEVSNAEARRSVLGARATLLQLRAANMWRLKADNTKSKHYLELLDEIAFEHAQEDLAAVWLSRLLSDDVGVLSDYGLTDFELSVFLKKFLQSSDPEIRSVADAFINRVSLVPGSLISLQAPTLDGDALVETEDHIGKIVLLDHWDTNCAPCIAAFPGIHETYLKYQDQGFEVLSIAYDGESQRKAVERIKERMGLTWTTLNGEGLWPAVAAKYGYPGYPQYMLLDREGRWVAGTAEMGNGANLEALLEDLLAEEKAGYYDRQPPIWQVSDEDTTIYLYGTLHSVKDHFDWLSDEAEALLESSDIIYTEVAENTPAETITELRETYTKSPDGESLDILLSDDQLTAARATAEAAELDWSVLNQLKPGFAALELGNARRAQQGIERGESAEAGLLALVDRDEQELRYFASFERQMQYMAELPISAQINFLMNALEEGDTDDFDRLFQAWFWGDIAAIEVEAITDERTAIPVVYDALMVGRNQEWADAITDILDEEQGEIFVAVGVGHLVGPDSVQSMLEDRGRKTTRLH